MWRNALLAVGILVLCSAPVAQAQQSWLDAPRQDWNSAGMPVPRPPQEVVIDTFCESAMRPPETPEDDVLIAAGWRLSVPYQGAWGVKVIEGIAAQDGMCRPIRYQQFVFVEGAFAGTIAPAPMNSRAGDPGKVSWFSRDAVIVDFARFKAGDSFCCPSGTPIAMPMKVDRTPSGPVLRLEKS